MSEYQPFFVAFAHAHGKTPDEMNGPGFWTDFVPWIGAMWRRYFASTGRAETDRATEADFDAIIAYLATTYPAPTSEQRDLFADSGAA